MPQGGEKRRVFVSWQKRSQQKTVARSFREIGRQSSLNGCWLPSNETKGSQMTWADSERVAPHCRLLSSVSPPSLDENRRTHARGHRYLKKERAPLFRDALSHCLPRRCRFGEAPIPLQTRVDNRRRVADFQSRPVIKSRTTQPPWD